MLQSLSIKNLAIAKDVYFELGNEMNVITGETGAGKSIMLGALGLALGNKSNHKIVSSGYDKAFVVCEFDISNLNKVQQWIKNNGYESDSNECILKRVIDNKGKSKGFINGVPTTIKEMKNLGEQLMEIQGQHDHHLLLKKDFQLDLLDKYSNLKDDVNKTLLKSKELKEKEQQLANKKQKINELKERQHFLELKVSELLEFSPNKEEFSSLEEKISEIENSEKIHSNAFQAALAINSDDDINAYGLFSKAKSLVDDIKECSKDIESIYFRMENVIEQLSEIESDLSNVSNGACFDDQEIIEIKERYNDYNKISEKYNILPEELEEYLENLSEELYNIQEPEEEISALENEIEKIKSLILEETKKIHQQRQKTIDNVVPFINDELKKLGFKENTFKIELSKKPMDCTKDFLGFFIAPNVGQDYQLLSEIASGGELSRISLAIQVVFSKVFGSSTIIFDEVDVGIGGEAANAVGEMLSQLSKDSQIVCITHLAQVAERGDHHIKIEKHHGENETITDVFALSESERKKELSRMLYGDGFKNKEIVR